MPDQEKKQKPEIAQPKPDTILPAGGQSSVENPLTVPHPPAPQHQCEPEVK